MAGNRVFNKRQIRRYNQRGMKQHKIGFLTFSLNAGGLETYLLRFLRLYGKDISATVIVKNGKKGDLYDDFAKTGVHIILMKMGYFNIRAWLRLFHLFKSEKLDAVCDTGANFGGIPLTLALLAGIHRRIAYYGQSSHLFQLTKRNLAYANFMNWLVSKNATAILANSHHALSFYFGKKAGGRYKVIKNGVNRELFDIKESKDELRKYFGLPNDKIIVGHTGRLTPAKNHSTIMEVARVICAENKNVIFVLAGNGTQNLPAQEGVIRLGYSSEIPKLLKTFDIYYFPSVTEGQPNSLIEAMMAGLPFVASDIAPIKECVPENHFPQLVPATDIHSSVEKIKELIENSNRNQYCCKEWAIETYDATQNFNCFKNELIC